MRGKGQSYEEHVDVDGVAIKRYYFRVDYDLLQDVTGKSTLALKHGWGYKDLSERLFEHEILENDFSAMSMTDQMALRGRRLSKTYYTYIRKRRPRVLNQTAFICF